MIEEKEISYPVIVIGHHPDHPDEYVANVSSANGYFLRIPDKDKKGRDTLRYFAQMCASIVLADFQIMEYADNPWNDLPPETQMLAIRSFARKHGLEDELAIFFDM